MKARNYLSILAAFIGLLVIIWLFTGLGSNTAASLGLNLAIAVAALTVLTISWRGQRRQKYVRLIEEQRSADEALLSSIGDSIVVTDEYGRITKANPAVQNLLGFSAPELVGKGLVSAIPAKTVEGQVIPNEERAVIEALSTGKPAKATYMLTRKNGSSLIANVTASPYLIDDKPVGAILIIRDVSQQAAVDKAKTEFVSLASHQLRTPLSTINWYLEMMLDGDTGPLNKQQTKYLSEVYSANQRMVTLVNSLLNVSRIDLGTFAIEPQPTDIGVTVDNVLAELESQVRHKQLKIIKNIDSKLTTYNADPKLLHIIFQNLVSNAVKYTNAGGKITIKAAPKASKVVMSVSDTGYGIPKNQQAKVFSKLFRADNAIAKDTDGTGLGLYMVKAIIEEAGGSIDFESRENKGSTFIIELPLKGMKKRLGSKGLTSAPVI